MNIAAYTERFNDLALLCPNAVPNEKKKVELYIKAGGKDRRQMLAPVNYVHWKSRIKRYIDTKPNHELIYYCLKNPPYKFMWADKEVPIFEGIDNDIYSIVNACPNACEMWKAIERLKQVNELRAERIARTANPLTLVTQQQPVYHPQNHHTHYTQNSSTRSQQAATRNRGKAIVNSPPPIYDQEPSLVADDDEMSKDKEIDKLMALISLSFKKIFKPTNNNLRTSSNTSRANQDNSLRINRGARLVRWFEKMENTFEISECAEGKKVKFATATLYGRALTWWNSQVTTLGREVANGRPWSEVKQMMTDEFCPTEKVQRLEDEMRHLKLRDMNIAAYMKRFNELALLCPDAVPNEKKKVELYIKGLLKIIDMC
nr:putative reverse transcriptase domain-containing protein [Tanacetum cinerariifolium]